MALASRHGQATTEWVAVLLACTVLATTALKAVNSNLATLPPLSPLFAEAGRANAAQEEVVGVIPAFPQLSAEPLPMIDGGSIVAIAEQLDGLRIKEMPPGSNTGPGIVEFTDGNAEAWCADFVSWVLRAAGRPFTGGASGGWRLAWTLDVRRWFAERGMFRERLVADPKPGDVVWFTFGHVGIVRRATPTTIETVEGNSNDAVSEHTYDSWRLNTNIGGFGRPFGNAAHVQDRRIAITS